MPAPAGGGFAGASLPSAGGGDETDEEALPPAFAAGGADPFSDAFASPPPPSDEDGPPVEALEAQMRGELAACDGAFGAKASAAARRAAAGEEDDEAEGSGSGGGKGSAALPELDELVGRLPAELRDTLDELFRARFVAVKKLPQKLFQPASSKAPAKTAKG